MSPSRKGRVCLPEHVCGEQVRLALVEARGLGLHRSQISFATELSDYHTGKGLRWYKKTGAREYQAPLTRDHDGFHLQAGLMECVCYERGECHALGTRLSHLLTGTIIPHTMVWPEDRFGQRILSQLTGVESLLTDFAGHS
jgi:hypothetical protein